jgi:hypothetical protein
MRANMGMKRRGRPPKAPKSPNFLPNPHLRRVRKNKGMKRGPRMGLSLQKRVKFPEIFKTIKK